MQTKKKEKLHLCDTEILVVVCHTGMIFKLFILKQLRILNLQGIVKIVQNSHILVNKLLLMLTSKIGMLHLSELGNLTLAHDFILISPIFPLMLFFSVPGPIQGTIWHLEVIDYYLFSS